MSGALYVPGADRTSRWFLDDYPNQYRMPRIDKTLLHSTETPKSGACPGYGGGSMAPQVTINPWKGYRKVWQHFPINRAGRALSNPSSTPVSENKDNVFQVEIIGYSDPGYGRQFGCYLPEMTSGDLDYLAEMLAFVHEEWPHSTTLPSTWPLYKVSSWAAMDAAHMSSSRYDAFNGILAHLHAPSPSTHGDVALNIRALKSKLDALLAPEPTPAPTPTPTNQEVSMVLVKSADADEVYASDGIHRRHVTSRTHLDALVRGIKDQGGTGKVTVVATAAELDAFGPVYPFAATDVQ